MDASLLLRTHGRDEGGSRESEEGAMLTIQAPSVEAWPGRQLGRWAEGLVLVLF